MQLREHNSPGASISLRPSAQRGHFNFGWLETHHSFSFGEYYDPVHMGFGPLRVINEDFVAPGGGFPTHPHRDMEIITYIVSGALEHKDSMGNGSVIRPGDVQYMCAGSGILHSEFNPSQDEPVHLLQIWIKPDRQGYTPSYGQAHFSRDARRGRLLAVACPAGAPQPAGGDDPAPIAINQDAWLYAGLLDPGTEVLHGLISGRKAWLQVVKGALTVEVAEVTTTLSPGDGVAVGAGNEANILRLVAGDGEVELLMFDLA